ncbi:hypothetical protein [Nocardia abscessus]|uniref:hypothetical protein n=1 Tax=Nocardia abscessus TaxID=120957 RepID=UPI002458CA26|nr:hypothetical protein [Nocardia abscessus]
MFGSALSSGRAPVPSGEGAVELKVPVPASGEITLANGRQKVSLRAYVGRVVTVWANPRSLHISLDGHLIRTVASRLLPEHLQLLRMRGGHRAGPEPGKPALRKANGTIVVPAGEAIEMDRVVDRGGGVGIRRHHHVSVSPGPDAPSHCVWTATSCTPSPTTP